MTLNQNERPDNRNSAHAAMQAGWQIVRDVRAGAPTLRAAGKTYLPQFPAEHDDSYAERNKTATLFNAYARTVQALVGMVFKKNPTLAEDVPAMIAKGANGQEAHIENIDLAGTHLDVFAREVFDEAFAGHAFILVDMQQALADGATLADEIKSGRRPYWVRYSASQAVNFRAVKLDGRLQIGQITFEEKSCEPSGAFGEREVLRYRTFSLEVPPAGEAARRVRWEVREKQKDEKGEEIFPTVAGPGYVAGFDRIPVAIVYGKKTGFLTSRPPLLDLAILNVSYFQKKSDRDRSLHLCGNPMPIFPGIPEEERPKMMSTGSGFGLFVPVDSMPFYLEPQGVALEQSGEDLKDLRGEMASLGLSTLASSPTAAQTATETVIDFTQESSELETMARSCQDALELCLQFHARYLKLPSGGSLSLGSHLKSMRLTAQQVQVYSAMAAAGDLSQQTLWEILQSGDALPDTFNPEVEQKRLTEQAARATASKPNTIPDGGADDGGGGAA